MPSIEAIVERVEPLTRQSVNGLALERFARLPDLMAIPVVENDRVVGLVERDAFLLRLADPLGHAKFGGRPVEQIMDAEPAVVDARVEIGLLCDTFLAGGAGSLARAFVVTRDGLYWGVGTGLDLLKALHAEQSSSEPSIELREAAEARSRLVGLMGRDLTAAAEGVATVADLLSRQQLPASARVHVQSLADAAATMKTTIDGAIDLTRADAEQLALSPEPTPVRALMDDIQGQWADRAQRQGLTLLTRYDGDTELAAQIDAERLIQVFDALIGSAVAATRDGVVEAGLKAWAQGESIRIEARVRDSGPRIDDFNAAFDLDAERGAGVRLALARSLVQLMGGTIWAENNSGRGATYAFDLTAPRATQAAPADTNVAAIAGLGMEAQPHILIVDDNATNRVVAQALCEMFGCTSETAEDGLDALDADQARPFDLILMDIKMPRMDGVAATQAIRALDGPASGLPIIALTANADPDDARRYVDIGMACVVEKPIKPERLRLAMNTALGAGEAAAKGATNVRSVA